MYKRCPVCGSGEIKIEHDETMGSYIICTHCGFDESSEYDEVYDEEKSSEKAKGGSIYKRGGSLRTQKRK